MAPGEMDAISPDAAAAFERSPPGLRARLLALRALILETAAATPGVGRLDETLKWGQPSYLTGETGSGSTIRIDGLKGGGGYAMYFHCRSGLVDAFRALYGEHLRFEGKRAIVFRSDETPPDDILRHCVSMALTHHLRAGRARRTG